jgi:hypothetical protein
MLYIGSPSASKRTANRPAFPPSCRTVTKVAGRSDHMDAAEANPDAERLGSIQSRLASRSAGLAISCSLRSVSLGQLGSKLNTPARITAAAGRRRPMGQRLRAPDVSSIQLRPEIAGLWIVEEILERPLRVGRHGWGSERGWLSRQGEGGPPFLRRGISWRHQGSASPRSSAS